MSQTDTELDQPFADGAPIDRLFDSPRAKIISVLVDEWKYDVSVSDIARQAGIARSTVYDHLDDLKMLGVVAESRKTGNSQRYELADTDVAQRLYELDGLVLHRIFEANDDVEAPTRRDDLDIDE